MTEHQWRERPFALKDIRPAAVEVDERIDSRAHFGVFSQRARTCRAKSLAMDYETVQLAAQETRKVFPTTIHCFDFGAVKKG